MSERAPMQDTLGSDDTYQATLSGVAPAESESEPRYRDEGWLREQYIEKRLSSSEIAEVCECSGSTVGRWLREHGIETRKRGPVPDKRLEDSEWLREQYVEKELSTREIAEVCECSQKTVSRRLQNHGIETRSAGKKVDKRLEDSEWLREQYIEKRLSSSEIAEVCECSGSAVSRWLREHGIETRKRGPVPDKRLEDSEWLREQYVEKELSSYEIAEVCECSDRTVLNWLQNHGIETRGCAPNPDPNLSHPEWLREQYVGKQLSTGEIAEKCECTRGAVYKWLQKHEIKTRSVSEALSGRNNPNWRGGAAPYGRGWNKAKRRHVRERDNYTCQAPDCDTTQSEHRERQGQKLHVHHLQKARDIDDPEERNAAENLVTLCRDCHQRWEKVADAGLVPQFSTVADD